jgi:hypothetical protein
LEPQAGSFEQVICWASLLSHHVDRARPIIVPYGNAKPPGGNEGFVLAA